MADTTLLLKQALQELADHYLTDPKSIHRRELALAAIAAANAEPTPAAQVTDEQILEIAQRDEFEDPNAQPYFFSEKGVIAFARYLLSLAPDTAAEAFDNALDADAMLDLRNRTLEEAAMVCDSLHKTISDPLIIGDGRAEAGHNTLDSCAEAIRSLQSSPQGAEK